MANQDHRPFYITQRAKIWSVKINQGEYTDQEEPLYTLLMGELIGTTTLENYCHYLVNLDTRVCNFPFLWYTEGKLLHCASEDLPPNGHSSSIYNGKKKPNCPLTGRWIYCYIYKMEVLYSNENSMSHNYKQPYKFLQEKKVPEDLLYNPLV